MAKKNLEWTLGDSSITVKFINAIDTRITFNFEEIIGYVKPEGIVFSMFRHGLKQMLADSVAGAKSKDWTTDEQVKIMSDVWTAIKTGVRKERVNAKKPTMTLESLINAMKEVVALKESGAMPEDMIQSMIEKIKSDIAKLS